MRIIRALAHTLTAFLVAGMVASGQDSTEGEEPLANKLELKPTINWYGQLQMWGIYTMDAEDGAGEDVDSRADLFIRRGRFGAEGQVLEYLDYTVTLAYDNLGKNAFTANPSTAQPDENKELYIWDLYFTYEADPTWAHVVFGYFRPQVGRESITSGFQVDSFEKSLTNSYPRRHLVGRNNGRETGINLGGLYNNDGWGLNYNVGAFDTNHEAIVGDTVEGGDQWSPLLAARCALTMGDPEMDEYSINYRANYWGKRNGTTLGVNVTEQDETDVFDRNNLYGVDLLSNYGNVSFMAEFDWLRRDTGPDSYTDRVYNLRLGYNIDVEGGKILEPAVMFTRFSGADDSQLWPGQSQDLLDLGVNYYINKNRLKLNLHYVFQDDEPNSGDFLGMGLQLMF
ncbi:MAG: porin [Planctomycetota bacterium]